MANVIENLLCAALLIGGIAYVFTGKVWEHIAWLGQTF